MNPATVVRNQIDALIRDGAVEAIDSVELNRKVKRLYRIEHARIDLILTIEPGRYSADMIRDGEPWSWVLTKQGEFRLAAIRDVPEEMGVKHIQLSLGNDVVFAGNLKRVRGVVYADLMSGTYSRMGARRQFDVDVAFFAYWARALLGGFLVAEDIVMVRAARVMSESLLNEMALTVTCRPA